MPKADNGRFAVNEVLINNHAISNLIRENKSHQIYSQIQLNQQNTGMQTQTQAMEKAVQMGIITKENAIRYSTNQQELAGKLGAI